TCRNKTRNLRMASVCRVAAKAADGGDHSKALAGNARCASAGLRQLARGIAGYGYFCGVFAAREAVEGRQKTEVDSFDGRWSGATHVSRVARRGNPSDESERRVFGAHGGTYHGLDCGARAKLSGLRAATGPRELVAAGIVGQATAFGRSEWTGAAHCGLRLDWARTGEAREGVRNACLGSNALG